MAPRAGPALGRSRGGSPRAVAPRPVTTTALRLLLAVVAASLRGVAGQEEGPSDGAWRSVVCWCPSGRRGARFPEACGAAAARGGVCKRYFSVIAGFSGEFPEGVIRIMEGGSVPEADQACAMDELMTCSESQKVWGVATQKIDTTMWSLWNLDILDGQKDQQYKYSSMGTGVNIYVLDTGVAALHPQFGYPQEDIDSGLFKESDRRVVGGISVFPGDSTRDCFGHGTAVAGVAAGKTFGVAKNATVVSVRTLNCEGLANTEDVLTAMSWVLDNHKKPAVVQMALTTQNVDMRMDEGAASLVAAGLPVVASAGNFNINTSSCSPARHPSVIAVAASDYDNRPWRKSNWGPDVTLYAPGTGITSAWKLRTSPPPIERTDGTSVAAPHVSGAIALHLQYHPTHSPQQVLQVLMQNAKIGALEGVPEGTPNILLQVNPRADVALLDVGAKDLGDVLTYSGGTETKEVVIRNSGSAKLQFQLEAKASGLFGAWFSAEPSTGELQPEANVTITVTYDAGGLRTGRYSGGLVIKSNALNDWVEVAVGLLVMCDEFRGHSQSGPRTIEVFPNSASARHDVEPPWPMEDQYFIDPGTADVWVELPIRYSHPVKAVPVGAVASSVGAVLEVAEADDRGRVCGDFVIRARVRIAPWESTSTTVRITVMDGAVTDVYGIPFPKAEQNITVEHRPYGRLFGMGMAATGDSLPVTSSSSVHVMAVFSRPLSIPAMTPEMFFVEGPEAGWSVKHVRSVHENGLYHSVLVELPGDYTGPVSVVLRADDLQSTEGDPVMPVMPLHFSRGADAFVELTALRMTLTPSMTGNRSP